MGQSYKPELLSEKAVKQRKSRCVALILISLITIPSSIFWMLKSGKSFSLKIPETATAGLVFCLGIQCFGHYLMYSIDLNCCKLIKKAREQKLKPEFTKRITIGHSLGYWLTALGIIGFSICCTAFTKHKGIVFLAAAVLNIYILYQHSKTLKSHVAWDSK